MVYSTLTDIQIAGQTSYSILTDARITSGSPVYSILTGAHMTDAGGSLTVDAGGVQTVDPFVVVALSATVGGSPDSVLWELIGSNNLVGIPIGGILPADATAAQTTYLATPTFNGATLTWRITATKAGQASVSDTVQHRIRPHAGPWVQIGANSYRPIQIIGYRDPDFFP